MAAPVIDPGTGLPQLPEGFFWRVRSKRNIGSDGKPRRLTGEDATHVVEILQKVRVGKYFGLVTVDGEKSVLVTDIIRKETVNRQNDESRYLTRGRAQKIVDDWGRGEAVGVSGHSSYTFVAVDRTVDTESVLRTATEAWRTWTWSLERDAKKAAEQAELDALLGDYPPKSL